jgi:endoglucanase
MMIRDHSKYSCIKAGGVSRRQFLKTLIAGGTALMLADCATISRKQTEVPKLITYNNLPRWRGFNLLEKYNLLSDSPYLEWDFDTVAEWEFDFVRLPTDYRIWTVSPDVYKEQPLREIDQAVDWARKRGIHTNLCLHRAPGYCVNPPKEPLDLWEDGPLGEEARRQFANQWRMLAVRYRGVPSAQLSFNLVNEPPVITADQYKRVVMEAVDTIRREDPYRLIVADGTHWGRSPVPELIPFKVAQSTRGYEPFRLTHYRASWISGSDVYPVPQWPVPLSNNGGYRYSKKTLWNELQPWIKLSGSGVGVHVGEWGAHNCTPHQVVLAWMKDCLNNWEEADIGWALWNLRGSFGPLDSKRADVTYENFKGHKLDREMLELLKTK